MNPPAALAPDQALSGIETERLDDRIVALVCRKCFKRAELDDKGVGKRLGKALRKRRNDKQLRVAETNCLGLCPKGGITVVLLADQAGGRTLARVVPADRGDERLVALLAAAG